MHREMPKDKLSKNKSVRLLLSEWRHLHVDGDGILRRETAKRTQLVVPELMKSVTYKHLREEIGHLGADRMVALARERFFCDEA